MNSTLMSRRTLLRLGGVASLTLLAACAPAAQPAPTQPPAAAAPKPTTPPAAAPTTAPAAKPTTAPAAAAPTTAAPAKTSGQAVKLRYALWDESFLPIV